MLKKERNFVLRQLEIKRKTHATHVTVLTCENSRKCWTKSRCGRKEKFYELNSEIGVVSHTPFPALPSLNCINRLLPFLISIFYLYTLPSARSLLLQWLLSPTAMSGAGNRRRQSQSRPLTPLSSRALKGRFFTPLLQLFCGWVRSMPLF